MHHGLKTIVCIGETLDQRESGELWSVLEEQLNAVADKLTEEDWASVVIAYEPVGILLLMFGMGRERGTSVRHARNNSWQPLPANREWNA